MKKILKMFYRTVAFSGVWIAPILYYMSGRLIPSASVKSKTVISLAGMLWILFNNTWSVVCEGKKVSEICVGDGLILDTGLKKESAQKRIATYPKVPAQLLSKKPEGIILGNYKEQYVRIPKSQIYHYCVIGGSGSGKTSTIILDTMLANFAASDNELLTFCIDIKGEIHEKSTRRYDTNVLVVNPSDRTTTGWDAWYRLHDNPSDDLIVESMEEIAEALIVSSNPKDRFFVVNARTMFTGLMVYYFKQGESFIDAVNHILESDLKSLFAEIIKDSSKTDLWYPLLSKFAGKDAESVEDCMVEVTTNLSVFSNDGV